jgi:hypothetical protein
MKKVAAINGHTVTRADLLGTDDAGVTEMFGADARRRVAGNSEFLINLSRQKSSGRILAAPG